MASPPPTFEQGTDYISDTEECKRLARNIVAGDFTPEQIVNWQVYNYSMIASLTGKNTWSDADMQFYALKGIETEMTAADLEMHYGDGSTSSTDAAQSRKDAAIAELEKIIVSTGLGTGTESAVGGNMNVGVSPYKSSFLNPDVQIPRKGLKVY
jgi:hypothetical protein